MELSPYLETVRKHYRLILAVPFAAALVAFAISSFLPPTYEAEAQLAIIKSSAILNFDPRFLTVAEADANIDQVARRKGLTSLAKAESMAETVIARLGDQLELPARIPSTLLNSVDASVDGDLIRIKARAGSAPLSALLANTWAESFQSQVNDIYSELALTPADVQAQVDAARRQYDSAETALISFLSNNSIEQLSRQYGQKQSRLADLFALDNKLQNLIGDALALKSKLSSSGAIGSSGDELARVVLEVNALNTSATLPSNGANVSQPINLQLRIDQPDSVRSAADQIRSLDALIATLSERQKAARIEAAGPLQQEINQLQSQHEQQLSRRLDLTRSRDLASSTLATLLSKVAEVTIAAQSKGSVVRVASTAVSPTFPVAPRKLLNTLLAGTVGLLVTLALTLAYEHTHKTVTTADQVSSLLGLKTVGAIPGIKSSAHAASNKVAGNGVLADKQALPWLVAPDAFHLLRRNLLADLGQWKVLLVTSTLPGEGKSFIAANLAVLFAETGKSVTLVDANFQNPTQHKLFGAPNDDGLQLALTAPDAPSETLGRQTAIQQLRLISSGRVSTSPTGLLAAPQFDEFVRRLRAESEIVLIDGPAALSTADAALMARVADCILLVVDGDQTPLADISRARELLSPNNSVPVRVVLNHTATPWHRRTEYHRKTTEPLPISIANSRHE